MNKQIEKAIRKLPNGAEENFILAVSGGSDSQSLLKAFPHIIRKMGAHGSCIAIGVNHGLRPEADAELNLARDLALSMGVPFSRISLRVAKGANIQARARTARYDALRAIAARNGNKPYIVTAHHFEDRAETVLIRLLRGKNIGSLGVMPEVNGQIFRPMLTVRKSDILSYLKKWNIPFANDPSNVNMKYMRSKIRHDILPALEALSPKFRERLNDLADEALLLK